MKRILLLVVIISLFGYIAAQENTWDVYLRGQAVKAVAFENNNVWVATDSFLVSLNTSDLSTTYYAYPDIVEVMTALLKIDYNGVKWIARSVFDPVNDNFNYNIYSFDGDTWNKINCNVNTGLHTETGPILSLAVDKNNNKWITAHTHFANPYFYKLEQGTCKRYTPENSGLVYYFASLVASDNDGNMWLVNQDVNHLDGYPLPMSLVKYDGENWTSFPGPSIYYAKMVFDAKNYLWIQVSKNELVKLDLRDNSWTNYLILNENYALEAVDGENKLWFTNSENGMAVYNGTDWSFYTTSNSELPSNTVNQIAIDSDGAKWIATENGLAAFNEKSVIASVATDSKMTDKISLFPNPAHDFIILKMPVELQSSTVEIININGKVIQSFNMVKSQNRLDVSSFPAGVYLVRIQTEENQSLKKFVKQ